MDAFRETHELMDSLIASYQAGCKDDTDAVREVQRLVEDTLAAAGDKEAHVQHIVKGALPTARRGAAPGSRAPASELVLRARLSHAPSPTPHPLAHDAPTQR